MLGDLRRLVIPVEVEKDEAQLALRAFVRRREPPASERGDEDAVELEVVLERLDRVALRECCREGLGRRAEPFDAVGVHLVEPAPSSTSRSRNRSATSSAVRSVTTTPRWG